MVCAHCFTILQEYYCKMCELLCGSKILPKSGLEVHFSIPVSIFPSIASPPYPDVEEDGEDDEDPNADRDPDHLNIIVVVVIVIMIIAIIIDHFNLDHKDHRMEDVCRFLGEVDLHNVGAHLSEIFKNLGVDCWCPPE